MWTRRKWLQLMSLWGGQLSLGGFACRSESSDAAMAAALFEVDSQGLLLNVFSPLADKLEVYVTKRGYTEVLYQDSLLIELGTRLVSTHIEGLLAATEYQLQLKTDAGARSEYFDFVTAASTESDLPVHFIYSADIDLSEKWESDIFSVMARSGAQFFLCLGDWPYADNAPGARTQQEFHDHHRRVRVAPRIQTLLQAMPCYAIYDDHEIVNNWDAAISNIESERVEAGLAVWDQWFPLRQTPRYRSVRRGAHLELFILDTRLYRSENSSSDDAKKTMLGVEQLEWLKEQLLASDATFKLIATSVPLDYGMPEDSWAAFTNERDTLLNFITEQRIQTVLFLCADQHFFCPHHFQNGIKEVQVGPLARGLFEILPTQQPDEVMRANQLNYGDIKITGGPTPLLTVEGRDQDGNLIYQEKIQGGVGALQIESSVPRPFETFGAHIFRGTAPTTIPYAPTGTYSLRWSDTNESATTGTLRPDDTLVL